MLVRDVSETVAFYERLGFRLAGAWPDGDHPEWAAVVRDGIELQFHADPPAGTPSQPVASLTLYLYPDSVDALAEEWRDAVPFCWGPEVMPYGMYEFGIRDPNGYYLAFTEPAED
ncbi:MAG: hypothetical protein D6701_05230 [Gemmatimonadetes bacterium]|nr:MAG: hypothetical protein D6701_05230 [Gemmatimonadota bacterium]